MKCKVAPANDPVAVSGEDAVAEEALPLAESEKVTAELVADAESPEEPLLQADPPGLSTHEKQVADQIDSDLPRTFPNIEERKSENLCRCVTLRCGLQNLKVSALMGPPE